METNEMIYTAIFQGAQGKLTRSRYTGVVDKNEAWLAAARMGSNSNMCLLALVPGDHPVYFYENFVEDNAKDSSNVRNHDLFELKPEEEQIFEMT